MTNATKSVTVYACKIACPLGLVLLVVSEGGALRRVSFVASEDVAQTEAQAAARIGETLTWQASPDESVPCGPAVRALSAFLCGDNSGSNADELAALPLDLTGTAFQQKVWAELSKIKRGQTLSYGELSRRVTGDTKAARAVGRANALNPVAIVVPCHRVVGANGTLTGYAYGNERKAALLALEREETPETTKNELSNELTLF